MPFLRMKEKNLPPLASISAGNELCSLPALLCAVFSHRWMDLLPSRCSVTAQKETKLKQKLEKRNFYGRKALCFYSGAALPSNLYDILERIISPQLSLMSLVIYELGLK